jgi:hypothetical protein|tara:strand:- start:12587 stop:14242 length:1656 start_codon:yes stop_codon:yes gene_type:complete
MRWFILAACLFLQLGLLHGQETSTEPEKQLPVPEKSLRPLQTIAEPLSAALGQLENLRGALELAATEDAKEEIQVRIDAERERVSQLRKNFRSILGGSEAAEYEQSNIESASIQDQITELIQPVLSEIHEATTEPRELDALGKSLGGANDRKKKTDIVLNRIEELTAATEDPAMVSELDSARRLWTSRQAEATSQIAVYSVQIDERMQDQRSLWEKVSGGFSSFFKSRGMNLLYAVLAAVVGYLATRKIYSWIRQISPVHKTQKNSFTRISDVLAMAVSVIVAIAGIIFVFYVRGDWLLLTLVVIFLIGVAWAGKTAIPPYLEQIRMILNLGSVREGERVIYEGLPWKVSRLAFYTTFTNPSLMGGKLRIPIRDVMDMISRPVEKKEVWFPSEIDDWVILSDETYGKMIIQSPDQVVILRLGGAKKTYPTADFLALAPLNLSHGFRVNAAFGIDYKHQPECTTKVPGIFQNELNTILLKEFGKDAIRSIKVEFASAAASSLDYEILADFDGSVAHKYNTLRRRIQSVCVDTCNANGWEIPFTQITVHQAES